MNATNASIANIDFRQTKLEAELSTKMLFVTGPKLIFCILNPKPRVAMHATNAGIANIDFRQTKLEEELSTKMHFFTTKLGQK